MKKSVIAIFAAIAVLSGCNLDVDSIVPAAQAVVDPGFGGTIKFAVWASGPWTATVNSDKDFNLTITPTSGPEGETLITMTLPENLTDKERWASVQFNCGKAINSTTICQYRPYMYVTDYYINYAAKMKDGNWWTIENYAYLPENGRFSEADFSTNTGIWLACETKVGDDGAVSVRPTSSDVLTDKQGIYFTPEQYMKTDGDNPMQGICSEGWHIPTGGEWMELLIAYGDKETGEADVQKLNDDGFNFFPYQYVIDGKKYSDEVLNRNEGSAFKNMASIGVFGSSTSGDGNDIYAVSLYNTNERTYASLGLTSKSNGLTVRCVRDKETSDE